MNESIYKQCSKCNKRFLSTQIGRIKCLLCTINDINNIKPIIYANVSKKNSKK